MNGFLLSALQTIIRALIGALNYESIKETVANMENMDMTGEQKRRLVLHEATPVIHAVGTALVSLAIECAVNAMRNGK